MSNDSRSNDSRSNDSRSTNNVNGINHITHDNPSRGYSVRHSAYDSAFNLDFEYGYLSMMTNFSTFVSRTQDTYSHFEEGFYRLLDAQRERRIQSYTRRNTNNQVTLAPVSEASRADSGANNSNSRENRVYRDHRIYINNDDDDDDDDEDDDQGDGDGDGDVPIVDGEMGGTGETGGTGGTGENRNTNANTNTNPNSQRQSQTNNRGFYDMGNILYSVIPRTVLIDPNSTGLRGSVQNRGLSIQQVEENTEIINYNSIPQNEILNTECPISISPFTSNSVVLRLKRCKHCFIPFRMMAWLETHSTCPLCRISVIEMGTAAGTGGENIPQTPNINTSSINSPDITSLFNSIRDNLVNSFNNTAPTTTAPTTTTTTTNPTPLASRTDLNNNSTNAADANNIFNRLSNLSIDNVNDDSIMFSFDMPSYSNTSASYTNDLHNLNNSYIIPQLSQLFSNTMSMNMPQRTESTDNNDPNTDNNSDNDRMDLD
uniref:RING-type domain-containing protein n=1 Tax=viral metagenome TaxID=1070528 RepID=A0A6C0EXV9_9ZZZZ